MADSQTGQKTLEMRVAELEDKLSKLQSGAGAQPAAISAGCILCYSCYYCYNCYLCRCATECTGCGTPCGGPCVVVQQATAESSGGFGKLGK
jgi:hypothetical protein